MHKCSCYTCVTPSIVFGAFSCKFVFSHPFPLVVTLTDNPSTFNGNICHKSFFRLVFIFLSKKHSQPNAKYFFSYKSIKINNASFDHATNFLGRGPNKGYIHTFHLLKIFQLCDYQIWCIIFTWIINVIIIINVLKNHVCLLIIIKYILSHSKQQQH